MAITSVGYEGTVGWLEWAKMSTFGADYSCVGEGDYAVTLVPTADRTVRVAAGQAWGRGVMAVSDAPVNLQPAPITSGSRWDTVVLRRNWTTKTSTLAVLSGTATAGVAAGRTTLAATGVTDDQPLALVQVSAQSGTSGVITSVLDVRCWASNGGLYAGHHLARGYLATPGSTVTAPSVWNPSVDSRWTCSRTPAGAWAWVEEPIRQIGVMRTVKASGSAADSIVADWTASQVPVVLPLPAGSHMVSVASVHPASLAGPCIVSAHLFTQAGEPVGSGEECTHPLRGDYSVESFMFEFTRPVTLAAATNLVVKFRARNGSNQRPQGTLGIGAHRLTAVSVMEA